MADTWVPFGLKEDSADYQVLVPGVPPWMRESLVEWVFRFIKDGGDWVNTAKCLEMQVSTRVDLNVHAGSSISPALVALGRLRSISEMELLRLADYIVAKTSSKVSAPTARGLDTLRESSRSKWTVGDRGTHVGLVERVPEGVQSSVEGVISSAGSAGQVLARAWAHVHGLDPKDSAGYADAVRAVEIAAIDLVQPNNSKATLGTVLGQMKTDGDWRLPLREHDTAPSAEMVQSMMRTLWHGHRDRHGSVNYSDVTHEEARAAVVLAATLVDWFTSGAVARRTT